MNDIIIVGAGTAGLSAAIYGVRAGKSVLILEQAVYGGQIINTPDIENYPGISHISGYEFASGLYNQAIELGAVLKTEKVIGIRDGVSKAGDGSEIPVKIVTTSEGEHEAKAVILATGAKNRPLGVSRETELIGAGVSYCATCDGAFFRGRDVAVVGGGNTALEDATFLSNYCSKVYVIHRRDQFRGDERDVERLREKENVEFVLDSVVESILGESMVEGIEVKNVKTGDVSELKIGGLFIAVGQMPDNSAFSGMVSLDGGGYIVAGEDCKTGTDGVFVAGDCRTKTVRQLTTAASDGAVAALAAAGYIDSL
ncbi:MAG TPA: thioredoxin-disulfide reductase [Lachnospiraceae bacterium]|nr:thioredoxin-disulfide reductase [Lachnospiraceae bacterium]